jgi:hypothetical protein
MQRRSRRRPQSNSKQADETPTANSVASFISWDASVRANCQPQLSTCLTSTRRADSAGVAQPTPLAACPPWRDPRDELRGPSVVWHRRPSARRTGCATGSRSAGTPAVRDRHLPRPCLRKQLVSLGEPAYDLLRRVPLPRSHGPVESFLPTAGRKTLTQPGLTKRGQAIPARSEGGARGRLAILRQSDRMTGAIRQPRGGAGEAAPRRSAPQQPRPA